MNSVTEALCSIEHLEEMEQFLTEIFTEKELEALDLRWKLMKQLKAGKTQREIAKDLHISLCKVTRGNKILKDNTSVTNRLLNKESGNE